MQEIYRVKTSPVALSDNMIIGEKYRITLLTEALVRLEFSEDGVFEDRATQTVLFRDFPKTGYHVVRNADGIEVHTSMLHLIYNEKEFSSHGLSIQIKGNLSAYHSIWHYGEKVHDLQGTARTLDDVNGEVELGHGVVSRFGYSILDDSKSQILLDDGWIEPRKKGVSDLYFFGYGHDYKQALNDFYRLCGKTPMLPRYALGNWWSRYYKYSEESYMELMDKFDEKNIPFTVAVIDMDWHQVDVDPKYGSGWTGYTWNKKLFPDPKRFLGKLHDRGMHTTLNVHPADGVQGCEEMYVDMAKEMGEGRYYADMLERMAQFELTLLDWAEAHKGARKYVVFADKCWPAFPSQFGFEPCYVNSRLASRGIPVACEVDIYGALSEYIGACVTGDAVTLLDINNSVPQYIYDEDIKGKFDYKLTDTFMGFHCGNTPSCKMCDNRAVKYQLIQHRLLEPAGSDPDFTRGTLEGDIAPSPITFYRLQCDSDGVVRSYIAEGEVLPVATRSFGGIGVFAINEMGRFYRHVLVQQRYPHHGAVAFDHCAKQLFEVFKYLGVQDIAWNQPKSLPYPTENPWA